MAVVYEQKITEYLEKMNWMPESVQDEDGYLHFIVRVALDYKEAPIDIRFKPNGRWISISSIFIDNIDNCKCSNGRIYEKLMQINFETTLTKFGAHNKAIYALIELPLPDLDYEEFAVALRRITNDLNKYYPQLIEIPEIIS